MRTVTIISNDRRGLLSDISYILGKTGINIDSLNVDVIDRRAVISLEVRDPKKAKTTLEKNGFSTAHLKSIVIKLANPEKTIEEVVEMLESENVKVEEKTLISADAHDGIFALMVDKPRKAAKMLRDLMVINSPPYR